MREEAPREDPDYCPRCHGAVKCEGIWFGKRASYRFHCPSCGLATRKHPYFWQAWNEWRRLK